VRVASGAGRDAIGIEVGDDPHLCLCGDRAGGERLRDGDACGLVAVDAPDDDGVRGAVRVTISIAVIARCWTE
jgi:hypothetical protein